MRTLNRTAVVVRAVSALFATAALFAGMDVVRELVVAAAASTGDGVWPPILRGIENLAPDDSPVFSLLKSCTGAPHSRGVRHSHGCTWTAPIGCFR